MNKKSKQIKFTISETWPTPIIQDFDTFLKTMQRKDIYLTKAKESLDRKTLYNLNKELLTFKTDDHPKLDQEYYPLINFFQKLSIYAHFFNIVHSKGKLRLTATEILDKYQKLNPLEKYMSLFEALWVECDWSDFVFENSYSFSFVTDSDFFSYIESFPTAQNIKISKIRRKLFSQIDMKSLQLLSFLGIFNCSYDDAMSKYGRKYISISDISLTQFGKEFLRILYTDRPFDLWNMHYRNYLGAYADYPGQDFDEDSNEISEEIPFLKAFIHLFDENALKQGLPKPNQIYNKGTFVFKVSLEKVWRTIAISGKHTLDDLHLSIQNAFEFDNDHLYAFSMDSKRLSPSKSYNDPRGDDGPFADDAIIGKLYLYKGQKILYFFDFGYNWEFEIELMEISENKFVGSPRIIDQEGDSPEQYPGYGDDDYDYDEDNFDEDEDG